ncbi:MAG TPA: 4a-hydroxytetrahydrobiopterin dehydratase [Jatrophihabitans sp.]|nr:4a-hydroxytetrahydrobiopterin dehydratase [Jatrophihabitans sp.]
MERQLLDADALDEAAATLDRAWRINPDLLARSIEFPTFLRAVEFIDRLAPVAERLNHHPDLSLSWRRLELRLSTHDRGGVTAFDVELAHALDPIITELGGVLPANAQ